MSRSIRLSRAEERQLKRDLFKPEKAEEYKAGLLEFFRRRIKE